MTGAALSGCGMPGALEAGMNIADLNTCLAGVVGSTAYGLAREGSDVDRAGVYIAPTDTILGLDGPAAAASSHTSHQPDVALHEVGKFLGLCLKANPTVTELLWLPADDVCTADGHLLVGLRTAVLSERAVRASYTGYAIAQARRLTNRHEAGKAGFAADLHGRTAKHGRHCFRLLLQARELLTDGTLTVNVAAHRDRIFEAGELAATNPTRFHDLFEREVAALDRSTSVLAAEPDRDQVNRTLVAIRRTGGGL